MEADDPVGALEWEHAENGHAVYSCVADPGVAEVRASPIGRRPRLDLNRAND